MCLRGLTAMTCPCRGHNPGSTPGVGVAVFGTLEGVLFYSRCDALPGR